MATTVFNPFGVVTGSRSIAILNEPITIKSDNPDPRHHEYLARMEATRRLQGLISERPTSIEFTFSSCSNKEGRALVFELTSGRLAKLELDPQNQQAAKRMALQAQEHLRHCERCRLEVKAQDVERLRSNNAGAKTPSKTLLQ
ncbi:hypothetical protein C4553_01265 [Candidatus Parcubacteria bacterium]|nr:MAG: hypothetical protein C4553_01265 [Candidatus Parcubacteria bacterium]